MGREGAMQMTHSKLRAAVAALTILASPALVSGPAYAQPSPDQPAIGDPLPFSLPATRSFALENSLDVTFIDYGLAPTVRISVVMEVGNINDGADTYLADLTANMMEEGSAGRSAEELATSIAAMGGSVNVGVGWHTTNVGTNVLSQYGSDALALLADVVQRPDMAESEFDRVRQNLIRDTSVNRAQPGPIATEAYREILFGRDHPYGNSLPTEEQVRGYELIDVQAFYADNFGAGRTHIYVAGRFDQAEMEAAIREHFGDWQTGNASQAGGATPSGGPIVQMIDRPGTPQSTLRVGFPSVAIDHEDARALEVMNALLGGSFTSRLTRNLREDKGYTYSPRSGQTWSVGGGFWTFNADVNTEVTGAALMETFYEISRLQSEPIPAVEGDGIRTWMSGIFVLNNASTGGVIGQLANSEFWGLGDDYLENYVPSLMAVSNDDISRVANEYLDLDQLVLVIVGDIAMIEDQVRALPELANATFIMPDAE
jgi:zinc protease